MARSIKKGPFVDQYLIDKVEKMGNQKVAIKTWSRPLDDHPGLRWTHVQRA